MMTMPEQGLGGDAPVVPDDKATELDRAKQATVGSVPTIPAAPDVIVRLQRGLWHNGKWETEVELRELNGADAETLARYKDPQDYYNAVIVYGVARLGSIDLEGQPFADRSGVLSGLLVGERERIFLHIARVTYGDEREVTHACPVCDAEVTTTIIVSEDLVAKTPEMENPQQNEFFFTTSKGNEIRYRLVTGADLLAVLERKGANVEEVNTITLSRIILAVNGDPVVDPNRFARGLSMGDRSRLLEEVVKSQPMVDLNLMIPCASCSYEMVLPLSWEFLFRS